MLARPLLRTASFPHPLRFIAGAHDNTGALADNRPYQFTSDDGLSWIVCRFRLVRAELLILIHVVRSSLLARPRARQPSRWAPW